MPFARCSLAALLVVLLNASFTFAQVTFKTSSYSAGDLGSSSIAFGDFNNDGLIDMVSINATTLSFYKGMGAGKFAAPVNATLPQYMGQVVAADLNGDGKLDLLIAPGSSASYANILEFLGNGDGTFTEINTNLAGMGTGSDLALADFNGDHIPDLVISSCYQWTCGINVLLGDGDGTFRSSATLAYGGAQVVAGDFNADGYQDIAAIENTQLVVYLGDGKGNFQSPLLATINTVQSLAVGDFYNDRIQSLAVLSSVSNGNQPASFYFVSTVQYANGALVVSTPQLVNLNSASDVFYGFIAAGDLNGDFIDDVVVTGSTFFKNSSVANNGYMLGTGTGSFQSLVNVTGDGESDPLPLVRDLNLDSRHDIGTAWTGTLGNSGGAYVLLNTNAATNCAPPRPNKLSVHICAPTSGQTVGQTFTFKSAGNAFNGIAKRMELWIDGKKIGQNLSDQLNVTTSLTKGTHKAEFVVVDSFDNYRSAAVSFTSSY